MLHACHATVTVLPLWKFYSLPVARCPCKGGPDNGQQTTNNYTRPMYGRFPVQQSHQLDVLRLFLAKLRQQIGLDHAGGDDILQ